VSLKTIFPYAAVAVLIGGAYYLMSPDKTVQAGQPIVTVELPNTFSVTAKLGETAFEARCATCHGINAVGQVGIAPPLVHKIYEPSHHGDASFMRAAFVGVPSHHWPFGDMPPVEGATEAEMLDIIAYIRELQRVNGIH
jgi:cytochrome c2